MIESKARLPVLSVSILKINKHIIEGGKLQVPVSDFLVEKTNGESSIKNYIVKNVPKQSEVFYLR